MASLGSFIRSAARATYSAYRRVPIRWRLAGGSAALTFVILGGFAAIVGVLTDRQVRTQFDEQQTSAIERLYSELNGKLAFDKTALPRLVQGRERLAVSDFAGAERAEIRIFDDSDGQLLGTQDLISSQGLEARPETGLLRDRPVPDLGGFVQAGYRVAVRQINVEPVGTVTLLYAVPLSDLDHTLARVEAFLLLGVLGGTVLAMLAGLFVSTRAMRPIAS